MKRNIIYCIAVLLLIGILCFLLSKIVKPDDGGYTTPDGRTVFVLDIIVK